MSTALPRRRPPRRGQPLRVEDLLYPTLDLHGESADAARRIARRWLLARAEAGEPTVRIVTGRGLHSIGPAVLPGAIADLLAELKAGVVRRFEREPGGGAFRVELGRGHFEQRRPGRGQRPAARRLDFDPQLRREAEESLWELGVEPTPELIEAEMRRLRGER